MPAPLRRFLSAYAALFLLAACDRAASEPDWSIDGAFPAPDTVLMTNLTAGEIAALQAAGTRSVILPIGGVEQSGPFLVVSKHDHIVAQLAEDMARERGKTLVAPVVSFVPEGRIDPPTGHMRYPGAISLSEETYEALLSDICRSLLAGGFEAVFMIADSGGSQRGMEAVARRLDGAYAVSEFYSEDPLSRKALAGMGVDERDEGTIHTAYQSEALLAAEDPSLIRWAGRAAAGPVTINNIEIDDLQSLTRHGEALRERRVAISLQAMDAMTAESPE